MTRFTIRDLLLLTLVVGLALGWLVDHWRAAERDAAWEKAFEKPLLELSQHAKEPVTFETPSGPWRLRPDVGVFEKRSR